MKLTKKALRKLILREMVDLRKQPPTVADAVTPMRRPSDGTDKQSGAIGPLEYKLADVISRAFEEHERAVGPMAHAGASWPQEVDRAASDLEDALIDVGAMMDILKLIDDVSEKLHNGEYAMQRKF